MFFGYWVVYVLCTQVLLTCKVNVDPANYVHFETWELNLRSCAEVGQLLSRLTVQGSVWMLPWRRPATVNASWFVMRVVICIPIWFLVWRYDGYWYCPKGDMNYSKVASSSLLGRSYSYGTQRHCGSPGVVQVWGIHAAPLLNELSFNSGALDCLGLELFDLLSSWVLKIDVSGEYLLSKLSVCSM